MIESPISIPKPGGTRLEGLFARPDNGRSAPGLVVAPGSAYDMHGALIAELCHGAVAAGWGSLRFNWYYQSNGGSPSSGKKREAKDLLAALDWLADQSAIDSSRLVVCGKSLGSGVAWQLFSSRPELAAAVLLTPVMRQLESMAANYPGLAASGRPVLLVCGASDPMNNLALIDDFVDGNSNVTVLPVPGDHSLNMGRRKMPEIEQANRANIESASAAIVSWLRGLP